MSSSLYGEHGGDPSRKLLHSHHGIIIDDEFLRAVAADGDYDLIDPHTGDVTSTEKAKELWFKLLEIRKETGEPMILNRDRVDEGVVALGLDPAEYPVIQSNLCVAGDTLVLTDKGHVPIVTTVGNTTNIWDGTQFSPVVPYGTGKQQCYLATFSDGTSLECTGGHKFPVKNSYKEDYSLTALSDMVVGDKIELFPMPESYHFEEELPVTIREPQRGCKQRSTLVSVEPTEVKDTYCFTNEANHLGTFNGMVTGQCSEILLRTDVQRGNVCCLSSVNLLHWDDYKDDTLFFRDVVELLDNALEYFIQHAPQELESIVRGATEDRPLGVGTLGYFSYLESNGIAISDLAAVTTTRSIYSTLKEQLWSASRELGKERGLAPTCVEHGIDRRHLTLTAIAPNASSSIYAGVSPSIEPYASNSFTQKTLSGDLRIRNQVLDKHLRLLVGGDEVKLAEAWKEIEEADGSVQSLGLLTDREKEVFRTAFEHNQMHLITLQEHRQEFIDQGSSMNLFLPADVSWEVHNAIHWRASAKLKTLYYLRTKAGSRTNTNIEDTCIGCE